MVIGCLNAYELHIASLEKCQITVCLMSHSLQSKMQTKKVMLLAGVVPSAPFFKFLTIHIIIILTNLKKSNRY